MALVSLKETYPNYRETFSDNNLSHLDDYSVITLINLASRQALQQQH